MIIYYVAGGSYKSFYLNYIKKIKKCDLLIFNYGIFYEINTFVDYETVKNEILILANKLKCRVLSILKIGKTKKFCLSNKSKVDLFNYNKGVNFKFSDIDFFAGNMYCKNNSKNKIIFCKNKYKPDLKACSRYKFYMFCYNKGVCYSYNKKLKTNFAKCLKIILK